MGAVGATGMCMCMHRHIWPAYSQARWWEQPWLLGTGKPGAEAGGLEDQDLGTIWGVEIFGGHVS